MNDAAKPAKESLRLNVRTPGITIPGMPVDNAALIRNVLAHIDDWPRGRDAVKTSRPTGDLFPYTTLFSPIRVNRLSIKNRIVMGPMGNLGMAEETGRPSQKMIAYFAERARGGAGLLTSGLIPVDHRVDPTVTERETRSYLPRINGPRSLFSGWRDIAAAVHAYGAHFFIQLTAGLGRVGSPECLLSKHALPVSASWNPNYYIPQIPCRPVTDRQCRLLLRAAGQAAANAKSLGIDGVYLHGHEGYLLEQMTNPAYNRRRWGRFADWQAFGVELVKEIRARVGADYPLMYRIDLSLALAETYGERMDSVKTLRKFKRERTAAMTLQYIERLVQAGVDMFDVDLGGYDNWWLPHPPLSAPSGCFLPIAQAVKEHLAERRIVSNAGLPIPVVAVGKLGCPDVAERALRDGLCDMVMLSRPLLADPQWPDKARTGRQIDITPCIGDQEGCLNEIVEGGHIQCAVNPRTGFEDTLPEDPGRARVPRRVAVVGAGPAGIQCALTAARRGHSVTLFEKRERIGGMLVAGSRPRIKFEVLNYLEHLEHRVKMAEQEGSLHLLVRTEPDIETLRQGRFDEVVLCTGARQSTLPVEGAASPGVVSATDFLENPALGAAAERVLIIGGGATGCECAHYCAVELGRQVTVVEMLPAFMKGVCTANRGHLLHVLEKAKVRLLNCTKVIRIGLPEVVIERNVSPTVPDPWCTWTPLLPENVPNPMRRKIREQREEQRLEADIVVVATGLAPDSSLAEACAQGGVAPGIHRIGNAFQVGRILEAVKAGYSLGSIL